MENWEISRKSLRNLRLGPKGIQKKKGPPRQDSPSTHDSRNHTSFHPDQDDWSWTNFPDVLYKLSPTGERTQRHEEPGYLPYRIHGRKLRNLPVLPDNISSTVEEFRVEAWQRLDPRVTLTDITNRMHPNFRIKNNALQQRGVRFRQAFHLLAWNSGNKRSAQLEAELFEKMEELGLDIRSNSTRGITPGLINPELGEAGGRVPFPATWKVRKLVDRNKKIVPSQVERFLEMEDDTCSVVSEIKPETPLPMTPEVSEHEAQVIEYIHEFVPYDEYHNHPDGALPVIRGLIPDGELPSTVSMHELDLLQGYRQPEPEIKQETESLPLLCNPDRFANRSFFWSPSSAFFLRSFCNLPCFKPFPHHPDDALDSIRLLSATLSKPHTPTTGIFPIVNPMQLNMLPEQEQKNIFDDMLTEYYAGQRELIEMPYYVLHAS
ncbi:hypothetical protein BDV12DRAFT_195250 [Aspergillus spectabilis]